MFGRLVLWILSVILVVRFAVPAIVGASAGKVFGEAWLAPGGAGTLLLDSDIRFWGVLCAVLGVLLFVLSFDVKRHLVTLDILMIGVLVGGIVRTVEVALVGVPAPPGIIATVVEWVAPLAWFVGTLSIRREKRFGVEKGLEVDAPKAAVWGLFKDLGGVDDWHPYMESASLDEGPAAGVGAARTCVFGPKMAIRETVKEWDEDGAMAIRIDFLKGLAPPIKDVEARVRVEPLGPDRCRLVLTMSYQAGLGPLGGLMSELFILGQYSGVFDHMLAAAKMRAETGKNVPQVVMPMSGRQLASA